MRRASSGATVEHDDQPIRQRRIRRPDAPGWHPVNRQHTAGGTVQAQFLGYLTAARGVRGLVCLDCAAGQVPGRLVDRVDDEDASLLVAEEGRRGHALAGQRRDVLIWVKQRALCHTRNTSRRPPRPRYPRGTAVPSYVLTGAPGAGKTAILRLLEADGYPVVDEAATDVIALQSQRQESVRQPRDTTVFVDRSPACTLALSRYLGFTASRLLGREVRVTKTLRPG